LEGNSTGDTESSRIGSIDQLRGYAIFGMIVVNASVLFFKPVQKTLEGAEWFESFLYQIQHHRGVFTYADTIAPLFVFVVGMGMRLSWLRRNGIDGAGPTRRAMAKRNMILILIAFALYAGWLWDALMDIGMAGLLAILLIDKSPRARIAAAFGFVAVYQFLFMTTSYGTWLTHGVFSLENPEYEPLLVRLTPLHHQLFAVRLNGGLLGPLSWVMMLLFGSAAYDVMAERNDRKIALWCLGWGGGLCGLAYGLHSEWPGVKDAWAFSAHDMTAPFPLWATGLCFFHLGAFYVVCDKVGFPR